MKNYRHAAYGSILLLVLAFSYAALLKWAPERFTHNPQDALWALPTLMGRTWWLLASAFASAASLTMFLYMIMNQPFSGLLVSRIILTGAMVCFALAPLNSGWLPWGVMLASIGGLYASFLIATNWCERQNKWQDLRNAITGRGQGRHDDRQRSILG